MVQNQPKRQVKQVVKESQKSFHLYGDGDKDGDGDGGMPHPNKKSRWDTTLKSMDFNSVFFK